MQQTENQNATEQAYQEAAQWIDILADGELDQWHQRRFLKWLNSENNQAKFEAMLKTWQDPALDKAFKKLQTSKPAAQRYQVQWRGGLIAASLMLFAVTVFWYQQPSKSLPVQTLTAKVENTPQRLADGSQVHVQPSSKVIVAYSDQRRDLQLRAGQAYFAVAKDKQRPFVVATDFANIKAVGTEFNIDTNDEFVDVTVYEGVVEVKDITSNKHRLVKGGERIRLRKGVLGEIETVDLVNLVDWRSGWIELSDQTLGYLVTHLNRYSDKAIVVADQQLQARKIAGRFRLTDTEQAVKLLSEMYSLHIDVENETIQLTR